MDEMGLVVMGAGGRMGRTLIAAIAETPGLRLKAAVERAGSAALGTRVADGSIAITDDIEAALEGADGVIDFTAPAATVALAERVARLGLVHVIGTTGCTPEDDAAIAAAAAGGACIVKSGNMSLGVNLLAGLVKLAARALPGEAFDIEVLEMHHRHKVDAPSGTALLLGKAAAEGRGVSLENASVRVRDGHTGARPENTIGFATLRGGSVVGDHQVILAGDGERIELSHRAEDRSIFARGALRAALWARGREPGLYSMQDVLGLS
ncbi:MULTISPECIES: 4-hydroxy-tetrahydrodipicolinate reductase [unclassified Aureimonas]|uniref:4-hydroxy-tetrahydrodipicolinate reductase n=1 Tax=unclassified Aureimonas TaxID=2615206 RepID=UPI0006F5DC3D|nr:MULTISPECIES: 4-hydroxy-tetrahydrodipicolinate reductase [unclassified Aureimonas]KQT64212.1 4-hydroxy-tetrahydrodipicolinate reductase [Aureimonas sp. Leaf427]KQT81402.1 4-hydroxy-tetrahydrodipicolinate reductase [Aureimonas sp. Leaf460]